MKRQNHRVIIPTLVITSGGFDPIHDGHLEYLRKARYLGDYHVCILNTDDFLMKKKGYCFYTQEQRLAILRELRCIDRVVLSIDDDMTVRQTIGGIYHDYKDITSKFIFAKGGDRFLDEIPEAEICKELGIKIVDGLGNKIESSSNLVEKARKGVLRDAII